VHFTNLLIVVAVGLLAPLALGFFPRLGLPAIVREPPHRCHRFGDTGVVDLGGALGVAVLGALLTGSNGNVALDAAFLAAAGVYAGGIALAFFGVSVGGTGRYREASGREPRAGHRLWPGRDKQ
jgi:hypothetical protein